MQTELLLAMQREHLAYSQKFLKRMHKALQLLQDPLLQIDVGQTPSKVVYTENQLKLLHYEPRTERQQPVPLLLIVYALINRPYILDLQPDRSVIKYLLDQGLNIYLIDWGWPGEADKFLTLYDYVGRYIDNCVEVVREQEGVERLSLLGYCMGGTMSIIYTALYPDKVKNLLTMAAPVTFRPGTGLLGLWSDLKYFNVDKLVDTFGNVPVEFLDWSFRMVSPVYILFDRYVQFFRNIEDREFVENFLRVERWGNDEIPVAGETFREFVKEIFQNDKLVRNQMRLNGQRIDLKEITMPTLTLIGQHDHLVPPPATLPFHDVISSSDKELIVFPSGHIGISISKKAHAELWPKIGAWLTRRSTSSDKE